MQKTNRKLSARKMLEMKDIDLVKKWLADPQSVSLEELEDNAVSGGARK